MKTLALLIAIIACSCAPRAIVVEPLAPKAVKARADVHAAAVSSQRVKTEASAVHIEAKGIAAEVNAATLEVDRLSKLPATKPADFDVIKTLMNSVNRNAWAHEISTQNVVKSATETVTLNTTAEASSAEVETGAKVSDKTAVEMKIKNEKLAGDAAKWAGIRAMGWIALALAVFFGVLYCYVRFFIPRIP